MALIHGRKKPEGMRYRLWSTISDAYLTGELNESELREKLREEALEAHEREVAERILRTKEFGSSSMIDSDYELEKPWEEGS